MKPINNEPQKSCSVVYLGRTGYLQARKLQKVLHRKVSEGSLSSILLLLEHPHVYTLGRRGKFSDILASENKLTELGIAVYNTDRGGEATYHGPGQLIGYPIINLKSWNSGPLKYVKALEATLIATLEEFGLAGENFRRPTGVWIEDNKIAAIGVKVSKGATLHGFALNVNPDLSYFDHIVPCGMPNGQTTSISELLDYIVLVDDVRQVLIRNFGQIFGWKMQHLTPEDLTQLATEYDE